MEIILAIISTIIAITAIVISVWSLKENRRIMKQQLNLDLLKYGHDLVKEEPNILRFHGIYKEQLEKYNISIKEFIYLLNSFYAGQAYYEVSKQNGIKISNYRERILESENVKEIWADLIRDKLIYPSKYSKMIDKYYNI